MLKEYDYKVEKGYFSSSDSAPEDNKQSKNPAAFQKRFEQKIKENLVGNLLIPQDQKNTLI